MQGFQVIHPMVARTRGRQLQLTSLADGKDSLNHELDSFVNLSFMEDATESLKHRVEALQKCN